MTSLDDITPEAGSFHPSQPSSFSSDTGTPPELITLFFAKVGNLLTIPTDTNSNTILSQQQGFNGSVPQFVDLSNVVKKVDRIFSLAVDEVFEDGMESSFSKNLTSFILAFGKIAIEVLVSKITSESLNAEIVAESFRIIGRISQPMTHRDRLWILEHGLYSASSRIRDGAILGLSFLDDPLSIPAIKHAIDRESIAELRDDMKLVLEQLEGTANALSSSQN